LNLKLTLDGQEIRRYSICSSPDSGELRIAVKQPSGAFSVCKKQNLKQSVVGARGGYL
jgi:ring-1,2-phenylacetyl-CoA epoxidase subunit PaaE